MATAVVTAVATAVVMAVVMAVARWCVGMGLLGVVWCEGTLGVESGLCDMG